MTGIPTMTDFQALVSGAVWGALSKAGAEGGPFLIDVETIDDGQGNLLPMIRVRGRESGETLIVRVERGDA